MTPNAATARGINMDVTRIAALSQVLASVWGGSNDFAALAARDTLGRWEQKFFRGHQTKLAAEWLLNCSDNGWDAYYCPHLFSDAKRKKEYATEAHVLWADLDECAPEQCDITPSLAIQTSPGRWQGLWFLDAPIAAEQASKLSRVFAERHQSHGCDQSGWDLTQLLRPPGTRHYRRDGQEVVAETAKTRSSLAGYGLDDVAPDGIPVIVEKAAARTSNKGLLRHLFRTDPKRYEALITAALTGESDRLLEQARNEGSAMQRNVAVNTAAYRLGQLLHQKDVVGIAMVLDTFASLYEDYLANLSPKPDEDAQIRKTIRSGITGGQQAPRADGEAIPEADIPVVLPDPQLTGPVVPATTPGKRWSPATPEQHQLAAETETPIDRYRAWAASVTDAPEVYHIAVALIVASQLLAERVRLPNASTHIYLNMWAMLIGVTSRTRKTTSMNMGLMLLDKVRPNTKRSSDGSAEGIVRKLAEQDPYTSHLFQRDEVSGLFKAMGGKDYMTDFMEILTKLYDPNVRFTQERAGGTRDVRHPLFSLLTGGVPEAIYDTMPPSMVSSGFMPRHIAVHGDPSPTPSLPMARPSQQRLTVRQDLIDEWKYLSERFSRPVSAGEHTAQFVDILPDDDVYEDMNALYLRLDEQARTTGAEVYAVPIAERLFWNIIKVAAILGAINRPHDTTRLRISRADVAKAAVWSETWWHSSMRMLDNIDVTNYERQIRAVLDLVTSAPGGKMLQRDVMRKLRLTSRDMKEVFSTLEERGQLTRFTVAPPSGRGRRPILLSATNDDEEQPSAE